MTASNQTNPYLRTRIMTATPEELRLMLYDGALKFTTQARAALEEKNYESRYNSLMRAQKIVLELSTSLNHNVAPEICEKLTALYTFIYRLLVEANVEHDVKKCDEAVELLKYERETWQMLMRKSKDEGSETSEVANAQQTAISSLSQSA